MPIYRYRILRYMPNLSRDEWINVGVLLEDARAGRQSLRFIEEQGEIARVRRIHPAADEQKLQEMFSQLDRQVRAGNGNEIERIEQTLSTTLQFGSVSPTEAEDFDAEFERLYREKVAPPPRSRGGIVESARGWIKARLDDVLHRHRVPHLERRIPVEGFTEPGDAFKLDYGYHNGIRGFLHAVAIARDPVQAKVLAYTAGRVRARYAGCEFTAITEREPNLEDRRHAFVARLFEDSHISIVPLSRVEKFAEELRLRLQ